MLMQRLIMLNSLNLEKMVKVRNIGLQSLEFGDIPADGGMAATMAPWSRTFKESASIAQEDNETHEFEVEEEDDPIESVLVKKGTTTITASLVDYDPEMLQKAFGGAVVDDKWEEPDVVPEIEQSVRLTPRIGKPFSYPRCKITAKIEYNATRTDIAKVVVVAKKLKPAKAGVAAFAWG